MANHAQQGNGRIKGRNLSGCSRFDQFWHRLIWLEQRNTFWLLLDSVALTFHWMLQPFVTGWAWKVRSVSPLVSEIAWDSLRYLGNTVSSWVFGCKFLTTDQKSIRISANFEFFSFHWGLNFKNILQSYLQIYYEHKKHSGDWWNIKSQAVLGIERRVGNCRDQCCWISRACKVDSYNFTGPNVSDALELEKAGQHRVGNLGCVTSYAVGFPRKMKKTPLEITPSWMGSISYGYLYLLYHWHHYISIYTRLHFPVFLHRDGTTPTYPLPQELVALYDKQVFVLRRQNPNPFERYVDAACSLLLCFIWKGSYIAFEKANFTKLPFSPDFFATSFSFQSVARDLASIFLGLLFL